MTKVFIISTVHYALDNRIFYREAYSLVKVGYQVEILAVHDKNEQINGISIQPLKRLKRSHRPLLWFTVLSRAIASKADIFHLHDPELLLISPVLRLLTHRPVIYDIHESLPDFIEIKDDLLRFIRSILAWIFRWLEPFLGHFQSGLIFADDQIAKSFININISKTTLFNFPSDTFIENASKVEKKRNLTEPIILYLGGIKRHRGLSLMLDAFEMVMKAFPRVQLFLVGPFAPTSLEAELKSQLEIRGINSSVVITGGVPFEKIKQYLAQASIGWIPLPSVQKYQKNIPTKLFEYMAYSIPIVSSDLPPIRQFIENNRTGLLVHPDNPTAHGEAIIRLLNNPDFAAAIGYRGYEMVNSHYCWSEMEPRLLNLYEQILGNFR